VDGDRDRRFERKLWWLLILLLLFALLLTGSNLLPGPAWGEMPEDRALLHVDQGTVSVTVNGVSRVLGRGDDYYAGRTDQVSVGDRSLARLTFRGGGYTILCGGSRVGIGELSSVGRPIEPAGALDLLDGRLLADTTGTSRAFRALNLHVGTGGGQLVNSGAARFAAAGRDVTVAAGTVTVDGAGVAPIGGVLTCGDGQLGAIPVPGTSTSPSPDDSTAPSDSPSPSATASPSATTSPTPTRSPTKAPTNAPPTTGGPPPPPPNNPPVIVWANGGDPGGGTIDHLYFQRSCNGGRLTILYEVTVTDDHDTAKMLDVELNWTGKHFSGSKRMGIRGPVFYASLGQFNYTDTNGLSDFFTITVTATDSGGKSTTLGGKGVTLLSCNIIP
jgi:putative peptide zinc metalloprotease protein